jgi:glutathionylspermidine synthase
MKRLISIPRVGWEQTVESQGLLYHHHVDSKTPYWNETAYYEFSMAEVLELERVTNELHRLCLSACQTIIDKRWYGRMGIPEHAIPLIEESWDAEPPALYGRFDLAYNGRDIKLLEYNADTPTGLVEAAVIQWYWLQERHASLDQFNSIHERLVDKWKELRSYCSELVHFTCARTETREDEMTIAYLAETALQAGFEAHCLPIDQIGWNGNVFTDDQDRVIQSIFKLYPWEWLIHEQYGPHVRAAQWIEPAWKMLLSNKGILSVLSELFGDHPNLLRTTDSRPFFGPYVRKPLLSREGANISIPHLGVETKGDYGTEGFVYQDYFDIPQFDGKRPVIGSWVIDGHAAGMGIRESDGLVTDNGSQFVPHVIL